MTAEVIEGTAVELDEPRALAIHAQAHLAVGVGALAAMSDDDFERNLEAMRKGVTRAARMKEAIMVADEDYGLIPGTKKATLLKPGAEKLALAYGLTGRFGHAITYGHAEDEPPITVVVDCYLHLGGHDGPVIAQGMGLASSFENRYRWRKGGRMCPDCSKEGVIWTKGRGGQWWHPSDAKPNGGCGANFPKDDVRLTAQETGQVENPDPFELGNTLLKMAEKRAYVDAVLRATASSGLFTQDMEDMPRPPVDDRDHDPYDVASRPPPNRPELDRPVSDLIGEVQIGKPPVDLQLRIDKDLGPAFGFKLKAGDMAFQALALGPFADALSKAGLTAGTRVTVEGSMVMVPWRKGNKDMPPYARVALTRVSTSEWVLPAPSDAHKGSGGISEDEAAEIVAREMAEATA